VSSTTFSAELQPDPRLRRLVLGSGLLLGAAGIPLIATLGIAATGRALLAAAWLTVFARQWLSFRRAYARNGMLRVDADGQVRCRRGAGGWEPLEILPGSIVTAGWAWLRLGRADAAGYAELLRGKARQSEDWRRFQVIWRHVGAAS
jgi:hypothetical protein